MKYLASYVEVRNKARNSELKDKTFTSARNLLAVLRLATALARLRLSDVVEKEDVNEANRLVEMSKHSINDSESDTRNRADERRNRIVNNIKRLAEGTNMAKIADIMDRCIAYGFKPDEINEVIDEYAEMNVWQINDARTKISIVA